MAKGVGLIADKPRLHPAFWYIEAIHLREPITTKSGWEEIIEVIEPFPPVDDRFTDALDEVRWRWGIGKYKRRIGKKM